MLRFYICMEETLGQILRRYRLEHGWSIAQIEQWTKISKRNLEALECDQFHVLPESLYVRHFIRTYAGLMGLDTSKLIAIYEETSSISPTISAPITTTPRVIITPWHIKIGAGIAIAVIIAGYLLYQLFQFFQPPLLILHEPSEHIKTEARAITIAGATEKEARVFINGKEIYSDADGAFRASVDLQTGLNVIAVSAKKKHSSEALIFREILVTD